jgi:hypothetical protein
VIGLPGFECTPCNKQHTATFHPCWLGCPRPAAACRHVPVPVRRRSISTSSGQPGRHARGLQVAATIAADAPEPSPAASDSAARPDQVVPLALQSEASTSGSLQEAAGLRASPQSTDKASHADANAGDSSPTQHTVLPLAVTALRLAHVQGFSSEYARALAACPTSGQLVYPAGGVVVATALPATAAGELSSHSTQMPSQRVFIGHSAHVNCLALCGNGRLLATGQEGRPALVRLWALARQHNDASRRSAGVSDQDQGTCLAVLCGTMRSICSGTHACPHTHLCMCARS